MKKEILLEQLESMGVQARDHFCGIIRQFGPHSYYKGMEFTIPRDPQVYTDNSSHNEFILIKDQYGNYMRFYPSTFCKIAIERDENGGFTHRTVQAKGSAVEFVQQYQFVNDAMRVLAGKKLKITDIERVRVWHGHLKMTSVPTIDFIG